MSNIEQEITNLYRELLQTQLEEDVVKFNKLLVDAAPISENERIKLKNYLVLGAKRRLKALQTPVPTPTPVPVPPPVVELPKFVHPALKNCNHLYKYVIQPKDALANSKITFPDATETQGAKLLDGSIRKDWFEVLSDGGMRFNAFPAPTNGTTPNSSTPRCEIREYKDITTKADFVWNDPISRRNIVIFERLPTDPVAQAVFSQIHGMTNGATNKNDAKGGNITILRKPTELSTTDEKKSILTGIKLNFPYIFEWKRNGVEYSAAVYDGETGVKLGECLASNMTRVDNQYPKWGVYSPDLQVVHYRIDDSFTL